MPPFTVRPSDGGQLITRAASAEVGAPHYTTKRNIRRDLTDEILREGWDYLIPVQDADDAELQPFPAPSDTPITLIHQVRRPNGQVALIAGTKTTLYRFHADLGGYVEDGWVVDGYFEAATRWQVIGSGFSSSGRRWEVADINGTTVFNNGVDLPVAYRVEWSRVRPLYELREQGIVCVGTIAEFNGVLHCGDITELREQDVDTVLGLVRSGSITVSQAGYRDSGSVSATSSGTLVTASGAFFSAADDDRVIVWSNGVHQRITGYISPTQVSVTSGAAVSAARAFRVTDEFNDASRPAYVVTASGPFFTANMVGQHIGWATGSARRIAAYISSTQVLVDVDVPVAAGEAFMDNPLAYATRDSLGLSAFDRRQYRWIWGGLDDATSFAVRAPVTGVSGYRMLTTTRTQRSLEVGTAVALDGGGLGGGLLSGTADGTPMTLVGAGPGFAEMSLPVQDDGEMGLLRSSAIGSITGYEDLQDDGSTILKAAKILDRLAIYKEGPIYIARYTGNAEAPFAFDWVPDVHGRGLLFRNTLSIIDGRSHVYAGKNSFYEFNLTSRVPTPVADEVSNLFFDFARLEDTETIYAADNTITQEIWFVCPANTTDPVLAYDYTNRTVSTVDWAPTAAATLQEALETFTEDLGDWYIMGTAGGTLLLYGLTTQRVSSWGGKAIYYRRSARPYSSTKATYTGRFTSGLIHFEEPYHEKHITSYVLQMSSQTGESPSPVVSFYTARNQAGAQTLLGQRTITDSDNHGLIPLHAIAHFIADSVEITSDEVPARFHMRTWEFRPIGSRSWHKRP